ncbi:Flp pilus assembly protein CpaB [Thalassotalea crassostreae]|uniref:Flp pilus assembly protein CpaB n=1 Tax=Thalassotalea crassostreae TaxID=1763536 RepID=UPI000837C4D4|nr:Flp pilus assembly protein CpaB [Thalassotalea crassostreae]
MNKNVALFILLSVAFGLGAVYLANNWLDKNQPKDLQAGQAMVVVVNAPLLTGSIIEAKHLSLNKVPESAVPENSYNKIEDVVGMVVNQKLYPGDIVRSERVNKKGEGSSLASLISSNMRAVSIRVNDVVGVSGFILPGNKVDILTTFNKNDNVYTEVVLSNIKILAVDQKASNDENKPTIVRAVTLEVNIEQAETLMNSQRKGGLQLALRNPNDEAIVSTSTSSSPTPALSESSNDAHSSILPETNDSAFQIAKKRFDGRNKVEIIRGIEKETVQVSNNP